MKMMSKGSKEALTVLVVTHVTQVESVKSGVCGFYATLYRVLLLILLLMSKGSKVSNTMYCTLYTGPLAPARREGYLSLPSCELSSLPPVSPKTQLC